MSPESRDHLARWYVIAVLAVMALLTLTVFLFLMGWLRRGDGDSYDYLLGSATIAFVVLYLVVIVLGGGVCIYWLISTESYSRLTRWYAVAAFTVAALSTIELFIGWLIPEGAFHVYYYALNTFVALDFAMFRVYYCTWNTLTVLNSVLVVVGGGLWAHRQIHGRRPSRLLSRSVLVAILLLSLQLFFLLHPGIVW